MTECKLLGNKVLHSSCYNSQSQGLIERKVGVLKDLLKKSNQVKWSALLSRVTLKCGLTCSLTVGVTESACLLERN